MPRAVGLPDFASMPAVVTSAAALYLLLATTSGFHWIDSWHDEQRAAQIVLLGLVAAGLALFAVGGRFAVPLRAVTPVVAVLVLGSVSALASGFTRDASAEVALFALLCALATMAACFVRTVGAASGRWVERVALFIAAAHVAGALVRYAAVLETGTALGTEIWLLGFVNPRVASAYYALLIPAVALATFPAVEPDRRLRALAWVGLVGLWIIAAGLQARALWFSYALALPALLLLSPSPLARRLVVVVSFSAAVGLAVQWLLPLPGGAPAAATRDLLSLSARDVLWRLAWEAMLAHPLLGIGPGEFARLQSYVGAHPHNWVLQLASEWGIATLLVVLVGLAGCAARMRLEAARNVRHRELRLAMGLSVLVGLGSALVDGTLVMPTTQAAFALAFGLAVGTLSTDEAIADGTRRSASGPRWGVAIAAAGAAAFLALQAASTYQEQESERAAFQQRFPGKWLVPRFWECGLKLSASPASTARW